VRWPERSRASALVGDAEARFFDDSTGTLYVANGSGQIRID
jgi:hypothetical protein